VVGADAAPQGPRAPATGPRRCGSSAGAALFPCTLRVLIAVTMITGLPPEMGRRTASICYSCVDKSCAPRACQSRARRLPSYTPTVLSVGAIARRSGTPRYALAKISGCPASPRSPTRGAAALHAPMKPPRLPNVERAQLRSFGSIGSGFSLYRLCSYHLLKDSGRPSPSSESQPHHLSQSVQRWSSQDGVDQRSPIEQKSPTALHLCTLRNE
jgi:hypothetical protein